MAEAVTATKPMPKAPANWCGALPTDDIGREHYELLTSYLRDNVCNWDAMSAALELPATQLCRVAMRFGGKRIREKAEAYLAVWGVRAKANRKHKYEPGTNGGNPLFSAGGTGRAPAGG